MSHCVSGHVVRDVLKDHCTFIFMLKQFKADVLKDHSAVTLLGLKM